ncbi:MAG: hypothetical protein J5626_01840 [Lachnospiraceae bacterium]|nr:hypothetical protein [Lachnospiraceae bacterium]
MTKEVFLKTLKSELEKQSISNIESMIEYYDEMICDRMEEGMSEEDAVDSMDSIPEIVHEAVLDKSVPALVREKVRKSREAAEKSGHGWLWITLAIIGFPVWLPLLITAFVLALTFFIVFWVLVATLFIVILSLGIAAIACFICTPLVFFGHISVASALVSLGGAFFLAGIVVLLWKPCVSLVKGAGNVFAKFVLSCKRKILG